MEKEWGLRRICRSGLAREKGFIQQLPYRVKALVRLWLESPHVRRNCELGQLGNDSI